MRVGAAGEHARTDQGRRRTVSESLAGPWSRRGALRTAPPGASGLIRNSLVGASRFEPGRRWCLLAAYLALAIDHGSDGAHGLHGAGPPSLAADREIPVRGLAPCSHNFRFLRVRSGIWSEFQPRRSGGSALPVERRACWLASFPSRFGAGCCSNLARANIFLSGLAGASCGRRMVNCTCSTGLTGCNLQNGGDFPRAGEDVAGGRLDPEGNPATYFQPASYAGRRRLGEAPGRRVDEGRASPERSDEKPSGDALDSSGV